MAILKSIGEVYMELQDYDFAIKTFKVLKNYCCKWQSEIKLQKRIYQNHYKNPYVLGCKDFKTHYLSSLEQIGYIYRFCEHYNSAADYFKK